MYAKICIKTEITLQNEQNITEVVLVESNSIAANILDENNDFLCAARAHSSKGAQKIKYGDDWKSIGLVYDIVWTGDSRIGTIDVSRNRIAVVYGLPNHKSKLVALFWFYSCVAFF
jgi:hypothetical protein